MREIQHPKTTMADGEEDMTDEDRFMNVSVKQAAQEEEERRLFDLILKRPISYWKTVSDGKELEDTLSILLRGLRSSEDAEAKAATEAAKQRLKHSISASSLSHQNFAVPVEDQHYEERAKYIPLRISGEERSLLTIMEAALDVSDFTDQVDVLLFSAVKMREVVLAEIKNFLMILDGLLFASNFARGGGKYDMNNDDDTQLQAKEGIFQDAFEVARRYKISNPEKMRTDYGKLMYILQDSMGEAVQKKLKLRLVKPLCTVFTFLEERNALDLLRDPEIELATRDVSSTSKDRKLVEWEIEQKLKSRKKLVERWVESSELTEKEALRVLESIGDSNSFLRCARDPCDEMIGYLKKYFKRTDVPAGSASLAITTGRAGARLTHTNRDQYDYVMQSLLLWREVVNDMYKLTYMAEKDLLDEKSPYSLRSSGQGLCRMQSAAKVSSTMKEILSRVKSMVSSWVGSWMVHLGDHNVPNALTFIDKYNQVSRILNPIALTLRRIDEQGLRDENLKEYIQSRFGGPEDAKRLILVDFFRHGFDGSGADNYYDAGSCIDGRLTSAWNWCSLIEKKPYFNLFLLCGFVGFDGRF